MSLNFITKRRSGRDRFGDVRITTFSNGKDAAGKPYHGVRFTFFGDNEKKVSSTGYVVFAVDPDNHRVYFKGASRSEGFKLCGGSNCKSFTRSIRDKEEWEQFKGSYDLLFDSELGLYYVDQSLAKH